ncbi:MFS transporter [Streptomyces sp. NPDC006197]|uniref:MFS transporter n=1 Tax=Streptomyces sp. NPDC006197 TaxID=3156685 RepID=UPI0033B42E84
MPSPAVHSPVLHRLLPDARPQRALAASNFVNAVGSGLFLTAGVLYFTQAVRLPAAAVGLGLGIAGLLSPAVGIAVGHLADRRGARGVLVSTPAVQALATAAFVLADGFWPFVLAVSAATGAKAAGLAARAPLVRHYGGERPQEFRARLRAVTNVGISFGALLAGWAVQVGTLGAYQVLVAGNALAFAASAAVLLLLPPVAPAPVARGPRWIALRDRPYLALTALDGVMAIQFKVLTVAIPLWLVGSTTAPHWLVSGTMLANTALVVGLQVRASRGVDSPRSGGRAYRRGEGPSAAEERDDPEHPDPSEDDRPQQAAGAHDEAADRPPAGVRRVLLVRALLIEGGIAPVDGPPRLLGTGRPHGRRLVPGERGGGQVRVHAGEGVPLGHERTIEHRGAPPRPDVDGRARRPGTGRRRPPSRQRPRPGTRSSSPGRRRSSRSPPGR